MEGRDSLGVVRWVAGSDWFLVAKMDQSELYALTMSDAVWISLVAVLALFSGVVGFYLLGQNQQLALAQAIHQVQAERLQALNLLGVIADSSDDAIFAKDLEGRYVLFNRAASQFVGKPAEEVLGRDDRAIFPAQQAEFLIVKERRILAEDRLQTEEEVLDTSDGVKTFLSTKGPLRDEQGHLLGSFGIARDISTRKAAEAILLQQTAELAARNAELEHFNRATVGRELDMIALKQQVNTLAAQLGQKPPYALSFLDSTTEHKPDSTL